MPSRNQIPAAAGTPKSVPEPFSIKRARSTGSVATQYQSDLELLRPRGSHGQGGPGGGTVRGRRASLERNYQADGDRGPGEPLPDAAVGGVPGASSGYRRGAAYG